MSICDWWSKRKFDKALKRGNDALDRSIYSNKQILADTLKLFEVTPRRPLQFSDEWFQPFVGNPADCAFKKPDTVESVLNQFIALGYDKPVVVIDGVKLHDGSGEYTATIDGVPVVRVEHMLRINHTNTTEVFSSLESVESEVLGDLKRLLNRAPIETIEITY